MQGWAHSPSPSETKAWARPAHRTAEVTVEHLQVPPLTSKPQQLPEVILLAWAL